MKTYCEDWSCPARCSCAHHFGRSHEYAAMEGAVMERRVELHKFPRDAGAVSCPRYEFDKPKKWLLPSRAA